MTTRAAWPGVGEGTVAKIRDKVERARDFAAATFPDEQHRYEI